MEEQVETIIANWYEYCSNCGLEKIHHRQYPDVTTINSEFTHGTEPEDPCPAIANWEARNGNINPLF